MHVLHKRMCSVRILLAYFQNISRKDGMQLEQLCRLNGWNLNVGSLGVAYIYIFGTAG
jgi:hypothetical protein